MDEKGYSGFNTWGIAIFLIILFAAFLGRGSCGGNNGVAAAMPMPMYCNGGFGQAEKQEIIDSARTQFLIENTARQTQEQTMAGFAALGTKIDFYEYQNLRDQLAQERTKNVVLENRVYSDAKFSVVEAQLASIACKMMPKPDVTGVGCVSPNAGIINGLGITSLNNGCCMG